MYLRRCCAALGCLLLAWGCLALRSARCQSLNSGASISTAIRTATGLSSSGSAVSLSKSFSYAIPVTNRQSVVLSAEYVRVTSFPKSIAQEIGIIPTWKLNAVPITVGYQYTLTDPHRPIVPIVGVGLSYVFCRTKALSGPDASISLFDDALAAEVDNDAFSKHLGMGYGAQATFGLRASLTRHLFVLAQGRARYVNGLAVTARSYEALGTEFTNVDFSLGVGFTF